MTEINYCINLYIWLIINLFFNEDKAPTRADYVEKGEIDRSIRELKKKIRELKIRISKMSAQKLKISPSKIIEASTANMNLTKSTKYGFSRRN